MKLSPRKRILLAALILVGVVLIGLWQFHPQPSAANTCEAAELYGIAKHVSFWLNWQPIIIQYESYGDFEQDFARARAGAVYYGQLVTPNFTLPGRGLYWRIPYTEAFAYYQCV